MLYLIVTVEQCQIWVKYPLILLQLFPVISAITEWSLDNYPPSSISNLFMAVHNGLRHLQTNDIFRNEWTLRLGCHSALRI